MSSGDGFSEDVDAFAAELPPPDPDFSVCVLELFEFEAPSSPSCVLEVGAPEAAFGRRLLCLSK